MTGRRVGGVLLHPTSLPAVEPTGEGADLDCGCGDFGQAAFRFVDWLAAAGQSVWQVLPLNPVGPGNSPYMSASARAGSPLLVSINRLVEQGWLTRDALISACGAATQSGADRVDYAATARLRMRLLRQAAQFFFELPVGDADCQNYMQWCAAEGDWLDDYALFMAIGTHRGDARSWSQWPTELARRSPHALAEARRALASEIRFWQFVQWNFATQWRAVRDYANRRGVRIFGDLPIFVAYDSADVWAHQPLFELGPDLRPTVVAGVPPDYFSANGQLWGNPLYRWPAHQADGFAWWRARMRAALANADWVRIDHFRGLAACWEIPADALTAVVGAWRPSPGAELLDALRSLAPAAPNGAGLPIIAEDLGVITGDVTALRDRFDLPGMRVLQFAFGDDARNPYLPHNLVQRCVVYTGTHDNDTSLGWFANAPAHERSFAQIYLKTDGREIGWDLIHAASASVAQTAIYPMQDILGLDGSARMNQPGKADGQWSWRMRWSQLQPWHTRRLREISTAHGRLAVAANGALSMAAPTADPEYR